MDRVEERLRELESVVGPYGSALVAFSGGVDSSLALAVATRALSNDKVLAVTSNNETYLPWSWTWRAGSPTLWAWSTWL